MLLRKNIAIVIFFEDFLQQRKAKLFSHSLRSMQSLSAFMLALLGQLTIIRQRLAVAFLRLTAL